MFGKIVSITKNFVVIKISNNINNDILNYNVIFEENNKKILGEIEEVINDEAKISFLGEFINNKFYNGIIRRPTINANVRIINQQELMELVGNNDSRTMILGISPLYNNYPIKVNINDMFSNHMAILGNTGSGKTYSVARIIQNFFNMKDKIPFNSNIFIFSNTSEYDYAFRDINKINENLNYKLYTTDNTVSNGNKIKLPLWLLGVDDYVNLLDVTDYIQISIIEKMLNLVSIFARNDKESLKYKNHLIANTIISILYSNQINSKIKEQIFNILNDCYTDELNLDVEVPGVGYTREFRKCFDIDKHGDFIEIAIVTKYIKSFIDNSIKLDDGFIPCYFNLDQLEIALNFTLISEGLILNDKSYNEAMALKVKLHKLNSSYYKDFFNYSNYVTAEQYVNSLLVTNNNGRVQIVNFVLDEIDDRFAKSIVKIFSRILFKFAKGLNPRGAMPIHIIIEEAHRYVKNDSDIKMIGYNIYERIAKDGNKFGVFMNLITNKPTEMSEMVLSQCSNFIIFKLSHQNDLDYIIKVIPNVNFDVIEKQKSLQTGTCVAFGKMMKIPMIVKFQMPNPEPKSLNTSIYDKWFVEWKN